MKMLMLNSRRVATVFLTLFMLPVGASTVPSTPDDRGAVVTTNSYRWQNEQNAAGKGEYMAGLYESLGAGDYDAAIEECRKYRELRPDDPVISMLEGVAYNEKGELSTAIGKLSDAIAIDNTLWPAYYYRGLSYNELREYRKALKDLDKVAGSTVAPGQILQFYKNVGEKTATEDSIKGAIFFHRAIIFESLGETAPALVDINRAISYDPANINFYALRGNIYFRQQQYALAYSNYETTIKLDPANFYAWNFSGAISLKLGNYSKAVMQFRKANESESDNGMVLTNLGLAYWLQGEQVKAFESMGQALRGEPTDNTYYHTAYFHHISGRQDKALEYFTKSYGHNQDILVIRASTLNSTPATSPTRKFYSDELAVAKQYLTMGSTPAETIYKDRPPTLEITSVTLNPDPVRVNKPFDFHVNYKVDVPGSSKTSLPTILKFTILRGNKTLFASEHYAINVDNGGSEEWTLNMVPVPSKGAFTIRVVVTHEDLVSEKSIELLIN